MHLVGVFWKCCLSSLIAAVLLPAASHADCDDDVPSDCGFQSDFCDWTQSNWSTKDNYARLTKHQASGWIKSGIRCVGSTITHCLKFRFNLNKHNDNTLNVLIQRPPNMTEVLLWTYSTKTSFIDASVPISSHSNFVLIFQGIRKRHNDNSQIRLGDIKYETFCCDIEPSMAAPSHAPTTNCLTTTTTATETTTTTTEKSTTELTTGLASTPGRDTITELPSTSGTDTTTDNRPVTDTNGTGGMPGAGEITDTLASSDNTGTIVGVVVAVIVVAVVVAVVVLVVRRKKTPLLTVCVGANKEDTKDIGVHNEAFQAENEHYSNLTCTAGPHRCPADNSASAVDSISDYSVIRDVSREDLTFSAFQPMMSLYSKAQSVESTHKEEKQPASKDPPCVADPYDVVDAGSEDCQVTLASQEVEYKNLTVDKTRQIGNESGSSGSSPKESSRDNNLPQPVLTEEAVYRNVETYSLGHPFGADSEDKRSPAATTRQDAFELDVKDQKREGDYYNVEKTPATSQDPEQNESLYHILEEDPQNRSQALETGGGLYHILERETPDTESCEQAAGVYYNLDESNPSVKQLPSTASQHQHDSSARTDKGGYQSLDFQKNPAADAAGCGADESGQTYGRLNEGSEDTYDELSRERKRKVVDENYSHVQLD